MTVIVEIFLSKGNCLMLKVARRVSLPAPYLFRRFSSLIEAQLREAPQISDGIGVPHSFGASEGTKRPPSKRVLDLVDQILHLSLIEAADLCDICQQRLSEGSGGIPMRTPFVHPGSMFGITGIAPPPPVSPSTVGTRPAVDKPEESSVLKDTAPPAEEEKSIVSVKLVSYATEKRVGVIKEIRGILGLGLKESKELVESVPKVIKRGLPREEADQIRAKLEAAGGVVEFS